MDVPLHACTHAGGHEGERTIREQNKLYNSVQILTTWNIGAANSRMDPEGERRARACMTDGRKKCREVSIMTPRCLYLGESVMTMPLIR